MTRNSKRRAAEQAVIDAAMKIGAFWESVHLSGLLAYPEYVELAGAVNELRALGMELPGEARSSTRHPVTSDQAAAWMRGERAKSASARIVRHLDDFRQTGRTVDELISQLNMPHQTCSPRMTELRNDGWVVDSGYKRKTRSGEDAIVWKLSERAVDVIHQNDREGWLR